MADTAAAPVKKVVKKTPAAKPAHPAYAVMIVDAIKALKERGGSSRTAILKYIVANNKVISEEKARTYAKLAIRKLLAAEKLIQVKGSFKLPKEVKVKKVKVAKKPVAKKAKNPAAKKPAAKKAKKPDAKKAKKPAAKKPAAKKPAAKKPAKKAAKKPAAKKPAAKKPAAKKVAKK